MKTHSLLLLLASTSALHAQLVFTGQHNVEQHNYFNDAGEVTSTAHVTFLDVDQNADSGTDSASKALLGKATFKLVAFRNGELSPKVIAETSVTKYEADATVSISGPSADSYNLNVPDGELPRTMAGVPFTVNYSITGLLNQGEAAATSVVLTNSTSPYSDDNFSQRQAATTETIADGLPISDNGNGSVSPPSAITTNTSFGGQHEVTIYSRADNAVITEPYALASAKINIWPRPVLEVTDPFTADAKYSQAELPSIPITTKYSYPDSSTYLTISTLEEVSSESEEDVFPIVIHVHSNATSKPIAEKQTTIDLKQELLDRNISLDPDKYKVSVSVVTPLGSIGDFERELDLIDPTIRVNAENLTTAE